MAQKVNIVLTDDIDGNDADETVSFGLDGKSYEIDLSNKNAKAMRKALQPFVDAARKTGSKPKRSASPKSSNDVKPAEVRAWAVQNGYDVPGRGRIPQNIYDAFNRKE